MGSGIKDRLRLVVPQAQRAARSFAEDVQEGLCAEPKFLPCCYFYDAAGSALFEEITRLPEYYLTEAEREILASHAAEIVRYAPVCRTLVELGSGSANKTMLLLRAMIDLHGETRFVPIDISKTALEQSAVGLLETFAELEVLGIAAEYDAGLACLPSEVPEPKIIAWLGSSIGNLPREEAALFLAELRRLTGDDGRLLLGIDLRKDKAILEAAYDDAQGVTAKFNLNLLARINRELAGEFELEQFEHSSFYDEEKGRIDIGIVSSRQQRVRIGDLDLEVEFADGERIQTEYSYKYSLDEIEILSSASGWWLEAQFVDDASRFSVGVFSTSA